MTFPRIRDLILAELASAHLFRAAPEVYPDSRLTEMGVDDLDRLCLAMNLEEAFGFEVSDDDAAGWNTVADIVALVERAGVGVE